MFCIVFRVLFVRVQSCVFLGIGEAFVRLWLGVVGLWCLVQVHFRVSGAVLLVV